MTLIISGPCNSFNCLGHFKHVYDDDDDDDDDATFVLDSMSSDAISFVVHSSNAVRRDTGSRL